MSSFVCSDKHIATIAASFVADRFSSNNGVSLGEKAAALGFKYGSCAEILKFANLLAYSYRYREGAVNQSAAQMREARAVHNYPAIGMLKLINCFIYQCSEFDGENTSPAAELVRFVCAELRHHQKSLVSAITENEPWTI